VSDEGVNQEEIDDVCMRLQVGRGSMRNAFVALSGLARLNGADEEVIAELHGQFFDGNEQLNAQVSKLALLARLRGFS
jgi:hypothetical protein